MLILGIETSCDDTGVAIYGARHESEMPKLHAHQLYSQTKTHAVYGGVVPELASRDHIRKVSFLVEAVLHDANLNLNNIDAIAYTAGPGLQGALLVGASVAGGMASALNIPLIGVHHMEGHLLAAQLEDRAPAFPFVCLLVSGGHTLLVAAHGLGNYEILGESIDDAVGEAFDKTAKLLGLGYPGGAALAKLAQHGDPQRYALPRSLCTPNNPEHPHYLQFSFSGLKTAVRNFWEKSAQTDAIKADIAASFQAAAVNILVIKAERALKKTGLKRLVIAGGVGANQQLREDLARLGEKNGFEVFYPRPLFCTDNGAMIAYAGWCRRHEGELPAAQLPTRARWRLTDLSF